MSQFSNNNISSFEIQEFLCSIQMHDDNMRWMITMNVLNAFAQLFRYLMTLNRFMGTGFCRRAGILKYHIKMDHFAHMVHNIWTPLYGSI